MKYRSQSWVVAVSVLICASSLAAEEVPSWETVSFTYEIKGKEKTFKVQLPSGEGPIRGAIRSNRDFTEVAFKHRLAVFSGFDETGPSEEFLTAAAKAAKRPEIEHAGAVVIGCSAGGRRAAQWGAFQPKRTLAVILDHSWTSGVPHAKPSNDYGNLPIVPGVPMCFTATHDNMHQNFDRRALHYRWCTNAFRFHYQPCTTSIYFKETGHCRIGSRALQAVWLDEVLALRIPKEVPVDKAYALKPVTIKTGGVVKADLKLKEERSLHGAVGIGPLRGGAKSLKALNFWVPGPKTAALYVEWVKENGGRVAADYSEKIAAP